MGVKFQPSQNSRGHHNVPFNDINVTPMVDVMLVLLIIFMITSPMLVAGVSVDLPEANSVPINGQDEPLSVSIDRKGIIFIQETQISENDLLPRLAAISGQNKQSRIFVRGDKAISYGRIMEVIGLINEAGYTKVALITENASQARR